MFLQIIIPIYQTTGFYIVFCLYPLHQLMMMYADIGENAKAYKKAKEVRDAYVKIETKTTRQMREKADSIYHKGEVMQYE